MSKLEPLMAAQLASDIYDVEHPITRRAFYQGYKNIFDLGADPNMKDIGVKGKTGGIFLKLPHVMAISVEGKSGTSYQGQAFFAVKGTNGIMDGLTDLNAGLKNSKTGGKVHQGFQDVFNSYVDKLPVFSSNIHTIHCVGHSLGSALATLTADWLKSSTGKQVKLYTFGSPRVGIEYYTSRAEKRIGSNNIYRVYHQTDPVPMVPTWPFYHIPDGGTGDFLLPSGLHLKPWEFHSMDRYIKSTKGDGNHTLEWSVLKSRRPKDYLDSSIEAWLKSNSLMSFSLNTAQLLSAAILWVVKKLTNLAGIAVVMAGSTTFTLLDRLALLMSKGLKFAEEISIWVRRLIKRMAQMLGIVFREGAAMTQRFIRQVFMQAHHAVAELVRKAGRILQ